MYNLYTPTTNLTYLDIDVGKDTLNSNQIMLNAQDHKIGSFNSFSVLTKIIYIACDYCWNCTGNIEIIFANMYKIRDTWLQSASLINNRMYNDASNTSTKVTGNINVFSNKYNVSLIALSRYSDIIGEVKSLKNLKKLYCLWLISTQVTGSKTDLYNNGANITEFRV